MDDPKRCSPNSGVDDCAHNPADKLSEDFARISDPEIKTTICGLVHSIAEGESADAKKLNRPANRRPRLANT